jgi:Outer membrane efflux protein
LRWVFLPSLSRRDGSARPWHRADLTGKVEISGPHDLESNFSFFLPNRNRHRLGCGDPEGEGRLPAPGRGLGQAGGPGTDFPPGEKDWSAGVKVTWPLFTGFARDHERDLAKAQFQDVSNRIREEVVVARPDLRKTFEVVHAAEVLVADTKESLRLAEERYANGAGPSWTSWMRKFP